MNRKALSLAALLGLAATGAAAETVTLDNIPDAYQGKMAGHLTTVSSNGFIVNNGFDTTIALRDSQSCLALAYSAALAAESSSIACYVPRSGGSLEVHEVFQCRNNGNTALCERSFKQR